MSEELENSLQQAVESYLGKRLGAIDEQLSRLQSDFDGALKRLRESSANESLTATALSAAIFAHLQTARSQRLSGAVPEPAQSSGEIAIIKRAVEDIERQKSHADILGSLLASAAQFAERAALFVIRNDQAIGWRECEASDPANFELIGGVSLPLSADTLLGRAARSHSTWKGTPGSDSEDSLLLDQLGSDPQSVAAVPLVVRGKVVAILYADAVSNDPNAVNVDALELLARVAAMAVNLASAPRAVPEQHPEESAAVTPTAVAEPEVSQTHVQAQPEPVYTPEIEPQPAEAIVSPMVEEVSAEPPVEHVPEVIAASVVEEVSAEPTAEYVPESVPEYVPHPLPDYVPQEKTAPAAEEVPVEREPEPVSQPVAEPVEAAAETRAPAPTAASPAIETTPPTAPSFASQYAAPLGSSRRYGVSEPDLPIEVGEDERRLHNDARRFARLLVSEIKLYNEPKVKEGRSHGDLYDRLREDIDRSRQMYNKRVAPPVAARHDYFHQELVNTLAEGDPAKLGEGYPGAAVAVN